MKNKLSPSTLKRLVAYFIDMYLSDLCFALAVILMTSIEQGTLKIENYISNLTPAHALIAFALGLVLVFIYFDIFNIINPKYNGQTLGKYAMKLKVARVDGKPVSHWDVFVRYIVGFIFVENTISIIGFSFRSLLTLFIPSNLVNDLYYAYLALTFVSIFLMFRDPLGRMLHDHIAKTFVTEVNDGSKRNH